MSRKKRKNPRHMFISEEYVHYMGGTVAEPCYTIHLGNFGILEDLTLTELFCLRQLLNETYDHQRIQHFLWKEHYEEKRKRAKEGGTK